MTHRGPRLALFVLGTCATLLAGPGSADQETARRPHVLVLAWNDLPLAGEIILRTVRNEFGAASSPARLTVQYLDTVEFAGVMHDRLQADTLVERYRNDPVDVLIALGPTVGFVDVYGDRIWPGAKLVLAWIEGQRQPTAIQAHGEVITPPLDYRGTVEAALEMFPGTARILLVGGASGLDRELAGVAQRALAPLSRRVAIEVLPPMRWSDVPSRLGDLPDDTLLLPVQHSQDVDGYKALSWRFVEHVAASSNRPLVGVLGTYMGRGIVGGHLLDFEALGRRLAATAIETLGVPALVGAPAALSTWRFDARQLARWGIDERRLPLGSQVLYREPSAWGRYRTQIIAVGAGLALQSLIIAGLVIERRARRAAMVALRTEETRRQRAEAQARLQIHEQAHVHTMAAMGQMAATMAHEMNQPLAAALSNAQALRRMLERRGISTEEITATLADVIGESKRAGDVVKRIRTLARKGTVEFGPVDLDQLAEDVARLVDAEAADAGVPVVVTRSAGGAVVYGDRVQLVQLLLNLAQNAIQAARGRPGARVDLGLAADPAAGQVVVTVTDTGPGIAEDILPALFEPFVTTKPEGLGLGLAICRTIVELHEGEIHARNVTPHGAEMTVTLPRDVGAGAAPMPPGREGLPPFLRGQ
jgi:signal transduction histidine kinase